VPKIFKKKKKKKKKKKNKKTGLRGTRPKMEKRKGGNSGSPKKQNQFFRPFLFIGLFFFLQRRLVLQKKIKFRLLIFNFFAQKFFKGWEFGPHKLEGKQKKAGRLARLQGGPFESWGGGTSFTSSVNFLGKRRLKLGVCWVKSRVKEFKASLW